MSANSLNVACTPHLWIPLPDGTRLAARLWLPANAYERPVPALIEYLPYRKSDGTAPTDPVRHAWFAANGFASLRIDLRGSGDSDGFLLDEYHAQEHRDAVDAIAWVAAQPFCSGRVGMFGISWGGFNALQVAARRPPALRAIVSACSTDDRYTDDVHYIGGCVHGLEMLGWAAQFTAIQSRPPHPLVRPDDWRSQWLARLDAMPNFAAQWLAHPLRDDYWKPGSISEDYASIECPTMLVGGWADAYTNAIPRMLASLHCTRQALIGPWSHAWPNASRPGPSIDFHAQCLRWWKRWLCDEDNGVEHEPMLRAWQQDWAAPGALPKDRPGRWIAEPVWPPASMRAHERVLHGTPNGSLATTPNSSPLALAIATDLQHGGAAGVWCPFGARGDFPGDQREENARAACFASEPAHADEAILGNPIARLRLRADSAQAQIVVRLCDLAPDGSSLLVSRGVLNLTHANDHATSTPLTPDQDIEVELTLDAIAQRLPGGHRWQLAIAPSYWPMVWPAPTPVRLTLSTVALRLPVRTAQTVDDALTPFADPDGAEALTTEWLRAPALQREQTLQNNTLTYTKILDGGEQRYADGWTVGQRGHDVLSVDCNDPTSARVQFTRESTQQLDALSLRSLVTASMHCDATHFIVEQKVELFENDRAIKQRSWFARVPRAGA